MAHRIRECMRQGGLTPLGGEGKVVEADETYFGKPEQPHVSKQREGQAYHKNKVTTIAVQSWRWSSVAATLVRSMCLLPDQAVSAEDSAREYRPRKHPAY